MTIERVFSGVINVIRGIKATKDELHKTFPMATPIVEHIVASLIATYGFSFVAARVADNFGNDPEFVDGLHLADRVVFAWIILCLGIVLAWDVGKEVFRVVSGGVIITGVRIL
jgi:hypothetical protein